MFFVTFHESVDNIYAYDDNGNQLSTGVLNQSGDELRGIYLQDGLLYVVQGGKKSNQIDCFQGSGTSYELVSTLIAGSTTSPIYHPFAMAFDGQGSCYVTSQDTNVVTALELSSNGQQATVRTAPSTYLSTLYPSGVFLDGTVVASAHQIPDAPQTTKLTEVPVELGGLGVELDSSKKEVQNSVRDVLYTAIEFMNQTIAMLLVVDEPAGLVRIYDPLTGQILRNSNPLDSPVHLLINNGVLYVGAGNQVLSCDVPNPWNWDTEIWEFKAVNLSPSLSSKAAVSGMAFDSSGNFHVADRTENRVIKYDSSFGNGTDWASNPLPDNPEFLLYISD